MGGTRRRRPRRAVLAGLASVGVLWGVSGTASRAAGTARETERRPLASIEVCPSVPSTTATYVITVENVAAPEGAPIDRIALDFSGAGSNFDDVEPADVTFVKNPETDSTPLSVDAERSALTGTEPVVVICRGSDRPSLSEGDTLRACIDGVENPTSAGKYTMTLRFDELVAEGESDRLDSRSGQFVLSDAGDSVRKRYELDDPQ